MNVSNTSGLQFSHFDQAHWARVREARKAQGLPHRCATEGRIDGHPLIGQALVDVDGVTHIVRAVAREWCQGYATCLLLETEDGLQSRGYVRGTAAWHAKQIDDFVSRFPAEAPELIALS